MLGCAGELAENENGCELCECAGEQFVLSTQCAVVVRLIRCGLDQKERLLHISFANFVAKLCKGTWSLEAYSH